MVHRSGLTAKQQERFWAKVDKAGSCWLWTAGKNQHGYGTYKVRSKRAVSVWPAHRLAYVLAKPGDISGRVVLHLCDNPLCCNPAHLKLGDHADNAKDRMRKQRSARGESNGRSKLTIEEVQRIKRLLGSGGKQADIAALVGVHRTCIKAIADGRTWVFVPWD